jgi:glycosyltransferase involved in cell wall biosynthesis
MKAMRIALLSWESLHSITVGGVASHVSELAAALERKGHETHIFTRMAPGQRYYERIDGVHYHRCPYPRHPDFVDDINNMCRAFVDQFFVVEDMVGRFDVVHAHDWLTANAMIWIKQGRGHRGILTIHATEYARCGNAFPNGRSQRIRDQERAGAYWADRVIAVSHATRSEIAWMYQVPDWKTDVVYNGVSPHRFDSSVDPGEVKKQHGIGPLDPMVLFCGRLEWQKGPDLLVEAIPAVLRAQPAAKFVFVGEGGMRGQLEARVRQLGVAHAVRFLGFRGGVELQRLFKACETLCVPSRNEPFGIVVLEAWAARKPVVVTQNGGPNEYVTHEQDGLKIYPRPDSVAWGLTRLFSDFDHARRMGENGRRAVEERFTWDLIAEQTLTAYGVEPAPAAAAREEAAEVEMPREAAAPAAETPVPVEAATAAVASHAAQAPAAGETPAAVEGTEQAAAASPSSIPWTPWRPQAGNFVPREARPPRRG